MNKWLDSTIKTLEDNFGKSQNPVVYDVGSRDGDDGVEIARRIYQGDRFWKDSTIVLFECNPPQQKIIENKYPGTTLIEEAISDKEGTAEFLQIHGDKNMVGSSSLDLDRVNEPWVKETDTIKVKTRRLDSVIEELGHQDTEIDVMKIDIEHFSYEALVSLGKYLRNVRVFHIETEIEGFARNKTNLDVALYMQNQGYVATALEYEWPPNIQDQVWLRKGEK